MQLGWEGAKKTVITDLTRTSYGSTCWYYHCRAVTTLSRSIITYAVQCEAITDTVVSRPNSNGKAQQRRTNNKTRELIVRHRLRLLTDQPLAHNSSPTKRVNGVPHTTDKTQSTLLQTEAASLRQWPANIRLFPSQNGQAIGNGKKKKKIMSREGCLSHGT